jgi:LPXTG-motif cell wall-anchored protein
MVNSLPGVDNAVSEGLVWRSTEGAVEIQNITPFVGDQYGEIIGLDPTATVYQSVATTPGVVMEWSLAHRGYSSAGPDSMELLIGPSLESLVAQAATPETGSGVAGQPNTIADSTTWRVWSGSYTVPAGQTTTYFGFNSISSAGGATNLGNFIDSVSFDCAANQPAANELPNTGIDASFLGWTAAAMFGGLGLIGLSLLKSRRANGSR